LRQFPHNKHHEHLHIDLHGFRKHIYWKRRAYKIMDIPLKLDVMEMLVLDKHYGRQAEAGLQVINPSVEDTEWSSERACQ
jgi:hypothetical protein